MRTKICLLLLAVLLPSLFAGCSSRASTPTGAMNTRVPTTLQTLAAAPLPLVDGCVSMIDKMRAPILGKVAAIEHAFTPLLLDLSTGEKEYLPGEVYFTASVSPDHTQFAYLDIDKKKVMVVDANGRLAQEVDAPTSWRRVLAWSDEWKILLESFNMGEAEPRRLSSTIALDLSNGEAGEMLPEYAHILEPWDPIVHWEEYSTTYAVYSADLSKVVFPASENGESVIILWSRTESREMGRIQSTGYFFPSAPRWSPDQSEFVVAAFPNFPKNGVENENASSRLPYVGGTELFTLDREGNLKRRTFLTTEISAVQRDYSWSPKGDSIAFWLEINDQLPQLAILNLATDEVKNLCITGGDYGIKSPALPVWSPDGTYLLVSVPNEERQPRIILIDPEQGTAVTVAEGVEAVGWLLTP